MENILQTFSARQDFLGHLEKDVLKNDKIILETMKEKADLENLIKHIKSLGVYPEHEAMIPLAKNIYMKGRIEHTGEYYIKKTAHPDSYIILQGVDQTLKSLEEKVKAKESDIDRAEYAKYQLEERVRILKGEDTEFDEDHDSLSGMPDEIQSETGVAVKVGNFYEILEFED